MAWLLIVFLGTAGLGSCGAPTVTQSCVTQVDAGAQAGGAGTGSSGSGSASASSRCDTRVSPED